jgi:hypothetical protein
MSRSWVLIWLSSYTDLLQKVAIELDDLELALADDVCKQLILHR